LFDLTVWLWAFELQKINLQNAELSYSAPVATLSGRHLHCGKVVSLPLQTGHTYRGYRAPTLAGKPTDGPR